MQIVVLFDISFNDIVLNISCKERCLLISTVQTNSLLEGRRVMFQGRRWTCRWRRWRYCNGEDMGEKGLSGADSRAGTSRSRRFGTLPQEVGNLKKRNKKNKKKMIINISSVQKMFRLAPSAHNVGQIYILINCNLEGCLLCQVGTELIYYKHKFQSVILSGVSSHFIQISSGMK